MNAALIWFIASILLFAAEIITPGFVLACFGAGALVACIPALLGLGIVWQVVVFALGSLRLSAKKQELCERFLLGKEGALLLMETSGPRWCSPKI